MSRTRLESDIKIKLVKMATALKEAKLRTSFKWKIHLLLHAAFKCIFYPTITIIT